MNLNLYSLLSIGILLSACTTKNTPSDSVNTTAILFTPSNRPVVNLEDVFSEYHFVRLKNKGKDIIGNINEIYFSGELMIIPDFSQKKVFIYNKDGVLQHVVNKQGKGPGEYNQMADFALDKDSLEILDTSLDKIFIYDLEGNFVKERKISDSKYAGYSFFKFKGDYFFERLNLPRDGKEIGVYQNRSDSKIDFLDSYQEIPRVSRGKAIRGAHRFEAFNDSLFYLPYLDNIIYSVNAKGIKPRFRLEVPEENIPSEDFLDKDINNHDLYLQELSSNDYMYSKDNLLISEEYVYFNYAFGANSSIKLFFSKKTGKVLQIFEYSSKRSPQLRVLSAMRARDGEFFVMDIHRTQYKNLPDIGKNLTEESGPVLMFCKLRKF